MSAIYKNTAPSPTAPWVMPGNYTVRLSVNGKTFEKTLALKMDPRIKTSISDLQERYDLSMIAYRGHEVAHRTLGAIEVDLKQTDALPAKLQKTRAVVNMVTQIKAQQQKMQEVVWNWERLFGLTQESDTPVTSQLRSGIHDFQKVSDEAVKSWEKQRRPLTAPAEMHQKNNAPNSNK
jgi:hypothetical protein